MASGDNQEGTKSEVKSGGGGGEKVTYGLVGNRSDFVLYSLRVKDL